MHDYYLQTRYTLVTPKVAKRLKTWYVREVLNIEKVSEIHKMISLVPSLSAKSHALLILA